MVRLRRPQTHRPSDTTIDSAQVGVGQVVVNNSVGCSCWCCAFDGCSAVVNCHEVTTIVSANEMLLTALRRRGVVANASRGLGAVLDDATFSPRGAYAGFDPTAPGLHLGHLTVLMALARLQQQASWSPTILIGGATALIGDPTGRSVDRPHLSKDEVAVNVAAIARDAGRVLDFEPGLASASIVNNADFYTNVSIIDFLRDVGAHARVNAMLARDSVRDRVGWGNRSVDDTLADCGSTDAATTNDRSSEDETTPISSSAPPSLKQPRARGMSFAEFSYSLLQAADFRHLFATRGVALQVGGADQWGNISAGVDLVRRTHNGKVNVWGLTVPLVKGSGGRKFGKSAGNAVWLAPCNRGSSVGTSDHAFYQYLLRTTDADAPKLLRVLTRMPDEEVEALELASVAAPHLFIIQRALADTVTLAIRGHDGLRAAQRAARLLFGRGSQSVDDGTIVDLRASDLEDLANAGDAMLVSVSSGTELVRLTISNAIVSSGGAPSKAEARRLISGGAVSINGLTVNKDRLLQLKDLIECRALLIRLGKRIPIVVTVDSA